MAVTCRLLASIVSGPTYLYVLLFSIAVEMIHTYKRKLMYALATSQVNSSSPRGLKNENQGEMYAQFCINALPGFEGGESCNEILVAKTGCCRYSSNTGMHMHNAHAMHLLYFLCAV